MSYMKLASLAIATAMLILLPARAETPTPVFHVKDFGAACNGTNDDTAAIQKAVNAAQAAGGGIVEFPSGTCLLNSWHPSAHPWFFYNLLIGSNVRLHGTAGTRLLQGPNGRHSLAERAPELRNTVLAFGPDYTVIRFQNTTFNGGFQALEATTANTKSVVLTDLSSAAKFKTGDYAAVYSATNGDVIPTEISQVTSIDIGTGTLWLKEPLARSFSSPWIVNVTSLATTNVGVDNLIVQGTEPLAVTETFGFSAQNSQFIAETSIGGSNVVGLNLNTLRGFEFKNCTFTSIGPVFATLELAQRNSANGLWEGNTFIGRNSGFGEYAAHITFRNNHFWIRADPTVVAGIFIGGQDVLFMDNDVHCGNVTGGSGWGVALADFVGPVEYASFVGQIRIINNTFDCQADGNACLGIFAKDTSVTGNTIMARGNALGIHMEGVLVQTNSVQGNTLLMGTGDGILAATPGGSGSVIAGNTIQGSGAHGILVNAHGAANAGGITVTDNTISGFKTAISIH